MASGTLSNGKIIDEITIDDDEDDEEGDHTQDVEKSPKNNLTSGLITSDHQEGNSQDVDDWDDENASRLNQPVDFIFAVEDDNGNETNVIARKTYSSQPVGNSVKGIPTQSQPESIKTRSALRSQQNAIFETPVNSKVKTKPKPPEPVEEIPVKQLRSSVRETRIVQKMTQPTNSPGSKSAQKTTQPTNSSDSKSAQKTVPVAMSENKSAKITTSGPNFTIISYGTIVNKSGKKPTNTKTITELSNAATTKIKASTMITNTKKIEKSTKKSKELNNISTASNGIVKRKKKKQYWSGKEHCKSIGPEAPYVMLARLPNSLTGNDLYNGHDCLKNICPLSKRKRRKIPVHNNKTPVNDNKTLVNDNKTPDESVQDSLSEVISKVANSGSYDSPGRPKIGQAIRFQFWQTSLGATIPIKSAIHKAKVIAYDEEFDLYEIELFSYDYPSIPDFDKERSKTRRVPVNTMIVDWNTLADPLIM